MSEIILPTSPVEIESLSPSRLLVYSPPKLGKTTLLSKLDDCLVIDLERGTVNFKVLKLKANDYQQVENILIKIKESGNPYRYIALDTLTALEEMALPKAAQMYKAQPMGKNWTGNDVRTLPQGAGYLYLRKAVMRIVSMLEQCAERIILVAHLRDKMIEKGGKEVSATDIELTGKLRSIVCARMDAIAFLKRKGNLNTDSNEIYATFKGRDEIVCGARSEHLRGKEILLGKSDEDGNVEAYWNNIYID